MLGVGRHLQQHFLLICLLCGQVSTVMLLQLTMSISALDHVGFLAQHKYYLQNPMHCMGGTTFGDVLARLRPRAAAMTGARNSTASWSTTSASKKYSKSALASIRDKFTCCIGLLWVSSKDRTIICRFET